MSHAYHLGELVKHEGLSDGDHLLLQVVRSMQFFNIRMRAGECRELFSPLSDRYSLDGNSEGTTYWLAMALAIKELYRLEVDDLSELLG